MGHLSAQITMHNSLYSVETSIFLAINILLNQENHHVCPFLCPKQKRKLMYYASQDVGIVPRMPNNLPGSLGQLLLSNRGTWSRSVGVATPRILNQDVEMDSPKVLKPAMSLFGQASCYVLGIHSVFDSMALWYKGVELHPTLKWLWMEYTRLVARYYDFFSVADEILQNGDFI